MPLEDSNLDRRNQNQSRSIENKDKSGLCCSSSWVTSEARSVHHLTLSHRLRILEHLCSLPQL
jgi:hypothetical protein